MVESKFSFEVGHFDSAILNLKKMTSDLKLVTTKIPDTWFCRWDKKFQFKVGHFDSAILNFRPITSDSKSATWETPNHW